MLMNIKFNKTMFDRVEDRLLIKVEKILRILEDEERKNSDLMLRLKDKTVQIKDVREKLLKTNYENKGLKKEVAALSEHIEVLSKNLEIINQRHLESVELSVDLLSDLEYNKYKASFVDIDIKSLPGPEKIKKYSKIIRKFFLEDLKCCFICITYSGINESLKDVLKLKASKNHYLKAEFITDHCLLYSIELEDLDLPERKIGRIVIGRYAYKDRKKELSYNKRILHEIDITKRILENSITEIQNKDLAVKDALTGLYTRKFLEEKLTEEFNSLDLLSKLDKDAISLLQIIIEADGKPRRIIKNRFYHEMNRKDEDYFNGLLSQLQRNNLIAVGREMYLGESEDCYYFINSKVDYNLFIAFFDLDFFKDVNDNWGGHSVGDRVLKEFSRILKKYIRTTDIPIRFGGEEFVIVFPRALSLQKIITILENIRVDCQENLVVEYRERERNVTVSIGLTRISKYDRNIQHLINRADAALYKAKNRRNRIVIYEQGPDGYLNVSS
ncbi:MAG TPA: GGDEF domain-containing protein [Spirochaetota bacterium]|nr:GGDEF domain-containing protein [Spirochaetota bacterium]HPR48058.1 GGDEF domain-containing protein [Spirochaetota bacterium]